MEILQGIMYHNLMLFFLLLFSPLCNYEHGQTGRTKKLFYPNVNR